MKFLKNKEVELKNGGYLVDNTDAPVFHKEFVELQTEAHYLVSLSEKVKDVNFVGKKAVSFDSVVKAVTNQINDEQRVYVTTPKEIATPTLDKLQKEALSWLNNQSEGTKSEKLNRIMQKFNTLAEFEEFGLYFSEGIVKMKALYTLEQIVEAVTILEPHLTE